MWNDFILTTKGNILDSMESRCAIVKRMGNFQLPLSKDKSVMLRILAINNLLLYTTHCRVYKINHQEL